MALAEFILQNLPTLLLFGLTFVVVLALVNRTTKSRHRLPKGPPTIPFFGNALSLKENSELLDQLVEWGKEYGSVYTIYIGSKTVVVVNGWDAIKEVTVKTGLDFGDRPESVPILSLNPKRLGLFDTNADEMWRNQRKFAHTTLRGMGFGRLSLEPVIQREVNQAIQYFKQQKGGLVDPQAGFGVSASNIICSLVFNRRIDHGTDSADDLIANIEKLMVFDEGVVMAFFPSMWHVIKHTKKWRDVFKAFHDVKGFFHREIREHQGRIDASVGEPEINDFLDAYLVHRKSDTEYLTLEALDLVLLDLFLAGTDTVSTTLTWAVGYLACQPDIQRKIHDEIVSTLGNKQVCWSHRSELPYTEAAILEIQRLASVAPIVPRRATKDASVAGHTIPKGTELYLNLWSLHQDPDNWTDPKRFDPARFLQANGDLVKQPENFLPFSAGKRVCMGEQLAKMELFLFFASVLQQVKFSLPIGHAAPTFNCTIELVRRPDPFKVQVSTWDD